jgi:DNA-binding response OmpR family regulator
MARLLERGLQAEGHVVDVSHDGAEALALASEAGFDALVLDVMLPSLSGLEIVRELRRARMMTPILLLTARDQIEDRVSGLDAGADDYLTKPFAFDELLARLRALGRRPPDPVETRLDAGAIEMDLTRHEVRRDGQHVELSPTEFRLLELFLRHPNEALTRQRIRAQVWGYAEEPEANAVDLYVHYLRRRLGAALDLRTVRGVGYRLEAPEP